MSDRPDWWGNCYDPPSGQSKEECKSTYREERPRPTEPSKQTYDTRIAEALKKENLSVVLDNLITTIDSQKNDLQELEHSLKIERKNSKLLLEKISELEDVNNNLKTILKTVGDKDIRNLIEPEKEKLLPHLFISEDAPRAIFDCVYRAAIKIYHPDAGGDEEVMKTVNTIKDNLYKTRGWQ